MRARLYNPSPTQIEAFVETFLSTRDATAAAIAAGYGAARARRTAWDLKQLPAVKARLEARAAELAEAHRVRAHEAYRELAAIMRSSVDDYEVGPDGRVRVREGAHPDALKAVASVKVVERPAVGGMSRTIELKLWDKNAAIDKALRNLGLLTDRVDVTSRGQSLADVLTHLGKPPATT